MNAIQELPEPMEEDLEMRTGNLLTVTDVEAYLLHSSHKSI